MKSLSETQINILMNGDFNAGAEGCWCYMYGGLKLF